MTKCTPQFTWALTPLAPLTLNSYMGLLLSHLHHTGSVWCMLLYLLGCCTLKQCSYGSKVWHHMHVSLCTSCCADAKCAKRCICAACNLVHGTGLSNDAVAWYAGVALPLLQQSMMLWQIGLGYFMLGKRLAMIQVQPDLSGRIAFVACIICITQLITLLHEDQTHL